MVDKSYIHVSELKQQMKVRIKQLFTYWNDKKKQVENTGVQQSYIVFLGE